jgi:hypothetical protein
MVDPVALIVSPNQPRPHKLGHGTADIGTPRETDPFGDLGFDETFSFARISGHRIALGQLTPDPIRDCEATRVTLRHRHQGIA